MEDPATRTEAEKIIDEALTAGNRAALRGQVGWSLARQIAEALRQRGYLRSDEEAAREFYSDPEHLKVTGPGRERKARPEPAPYTEADRSYDIHARERDWGGA